MREAALPLEVEVGDSIEVVLPFLPKSKNQLNAMPSLHRRSYEDKWRAHLRRQLAGVGQYDSVEVEMELWFTSKHRRDWQNYAMHTINILADALVRARVIPDDTPEHFRVGPNAGIVFMVDSNKLQTVKARQRTVIRITPS
jgi:hypothetical protein